MKKMKKTKKITYIGETTYTEFIESGKEVFPKDMYPTNKFTFGKIKYCRC